MTEISEKETMIKDPLEEQIKDLYLMIRFLKDQNQQLEERLEEAMAGKTQPTGAVGFLMPPKVIISGPTGRRSSTGVIGQTNRPIIKDSLMPGGHDPSRRKTLGFDRRFGAPEYTADRRCSLANIVVKDPSQLFRAQVDKDWEQRAQLRRNSEAEAILDQIASDRRISISYLSGDGSALIAQHRRSSYCVN